jgi:hypothetical protein
MSHDRGVLAGFADELVSSIRTRAGPGTTPVAGTHAERPSWSSKVR